MQQLWKAPGPSALQLAPAQGNTLPVSDESRSPPLHQHMAQVRAVRCTDCTCHLCCYHMHVNNLGITQYCSERA